MSQELANFMLSNIVRPPNARSHRGRVRTYSGAAISSSTLVIATVEAVEYRELRLCGEATDYFLLEGRNQSSIRRHFNEIQAFVRKQHLTHLVLRGSPGSGKYTASPTTYMIEGALNLISGLHLEIVAHQVVSRWVRREGSLAPYCPIDTPRNLRDAFELAIHSACLSEAQERDPQFLPGNGRA